MNHNRTAFCWLPLAVWLAAGLAGCATEFDYTATTAGGQRLTFRLVNGAPVHASEAGIKTDTPRLEPDKKEKDVYYLLRFFDQNAQPPRSVKVEDVSDEKPVLMTEDLHPEIKNHEWRGVSRKFGLNDPELKWLSYIDESFRVYRFTIVLADGRTVVLHEGIMIPGFGKAMLREILGEKP